MGLTPNSNFDSYSTVQAGSELRGKPGIEVGVGAHMDTCGGVGRPRCVTHWSQISDPLHSSAVTWCAEISGALLHYGR